MAYALRTSALACALAALRAMIYACSQSANWRTDLYASRGTLMAHRERSELFNSLDV